jgi:hypothetical protein
MADSLQMHTLPTLITDKHGTSVWTHHDWPIEQRGGMLLSPRIDCSSLRLRRSEPGYQADWHVAGDPTLIVIRSGRVRLILRDGSERAFGAGDAFIAADVVPDGQNFDPALHGHRAEIAGDEPLEAIHIKLV